MSQNQKNNVTRFWVCLSIFALTQKKPKFSEKRVFSFNLVLAESFVYKYSRILRDIVRKIRCVVLYWRLTAPLKFASHLLRWAMSIQLAARVWMRFCGTYCNEFSVEFHFVDTRRTLCAMCSCLRVWVCECQRVRDAAPHIRQWKRKQQQQYEHLTSHQHMTACRLSHLLAGATDDRSGQTKTETKTNAEQKQNRRAPLVQWELLKLKSIFSVECLQSS